MDGSYDCGSDAGQKEKMAFFLWRGRHSSASGRDTAAFLSIGMKNSEEAQVGGVISYHDASVHAGIYPFTHISVTKLRFTPTPSPGAGTSGTGASLLSPAVPGRPGHSQRQAR